MWGNRLGWGISVLIVLATAWLVYLALRLDRITPPTQFSRDFAYTELTLPAISFPSPSTRPNASLDDAIQAVLKEIQMYERFATNGKREKEIDALPALRMARESGALDVPAFQTAADLIVRFDSDNPRIHAVRILGDCLLRAGMLLSNSDAEQAGEYYRVAFLLGLGLFHERLTQAELRVGLELLAQAAPMLAKLDPINGAVLTSFDAARRELSISKVQPIWTNLGSIDSPTIQRHAGDVFVFAKGAKERVWRVEAIFALGRSKFNAASPADRVSAIRLLKRLAEEEPDPIVRLAAKRARDLTIEEYRTLH